MNRLVLLIIAATTAGCSDPPQPDRRLGCTLERAAATPFATSAAFPPVYGTLAGWNPDGRWFMTENLVNGPGVLESSVQFERSGDHIIFEHNPSSVGTINSTELFVRATSVDANGAKRVTAVRVSDLQPDGSARVDYAGCRDAQCTVCSAKLIRATHFEDEGEGQAISLLSELRDPSWGPGYTFNVRVVDTLAYLIRQDGLHIIETADPAHPVELGIYRRSVPGYSNDVKLVEAGDKRFALIADSPVDVVDVTDPTAPVLAIQIPEEAHTVFTEIRDGTTRAYFGDLNGTCPVYDVTNPAQPALLGRYNANTSIVHDLSVQDGIAYLNAWEGGLRMVDFNDPANPHLLGSWPSPTRTSHSNWTTVAGGRKIALSGDENYDAHLNVVDIDPASPTFMHSLASWQTRSWISIHNIMAFGSKAYFTHYQDGVRVLSVADPLHPQQVGYYNTWDPEASYATGFFFEGAVGLDVDLDRKLIFVADSPRGLLILRDDTP